MTLGQEESFPLKPLSAEEISLLPKALTSLLKDKFAEVICMIHQGSQCMPLLILSSVYIELSPFWRCYFFSLCLLILNKCIVPPFQGTIMFGAQ